MLPAMAVECRCQEQQQHANAVVARLDGVDVEWKRAEEERGLHPQWEWRPQHEYRHGGAGYDNTDDRQHQGRVDDRLADVEKQVPQDWMTLVPDPVEKVQWRGSLARERPRPYFIAPVFMSESGENHDGEPDT